MVRAFQAAKGELVDPINFAQTAIQFTDLGLSPIIFEVGPIALRWYSLAYIGGIVVAWWYILRMIKAPGAPMAPRHIDSFVTWITLGIILGGRFGYVFFYEFDTYAADPLSALKLWEGGMSFHGGLIGVLVAIWGFVKVNRLSFLRFADYVAVTIPFGLGFGRVANFINGELWGRPTTAPWGIVFPNGGPLPRHPSQLYEAVLEGPVLFAILWWMFWKTDARYRPGKLMGAFALGYGSFRFIVEFFRESDAQLMDFAARTGLQMGQWLSLPLIIGGLYFVLTARGRRERVEPIAGTAAQQ
jgi:phosphatidylglycerol---prolipoprotein diacylglyceryl transferase